MTEPSDCTLDRRRVLRAGIVAAAALAVGERRALAAARPAAGSVAVARPPATLRSAGDLRALLPWQDRWWALVAASGGQPVNNVTATGPGRSSWGRERLVKPRAPGPRLLDMAAGDRLVVVGSTTRTVTRGFAMTEAGEEVRLRGELHAPLVVTSRDGTTWTTTPLPAGSLGVLTSVATDEAGTVLALGNRFGEPGVCESFGSLAAVSVDGGASWSWLDGEGLRFAEGQVTALGFALGRFVAAVASVTGSTLHSTTDGVRWTALPTPPVARSARLVVVAGDPEELVVGAVTADAAMLWRTGADDTWRPVPVSGGTSPDERISGATLLPTGDVALLGSRSSMTSIRRVR